MCTHYERWTSFRVTRHTKGTQIHDLGGVGVSEDYFSEKNMRPAKSTPVVKIEITRSIIGSNC